MHLKQFRSYLLISLVFLTIGCFNNGIEWSELSFTCKKPNKTDLVGTWLPTSGTIKDMKERGGYVISKHQLTLSEDGTFSMLNMPDWWASNSGESHKSFESGTGTWHLEEAKNVDTIWVIRLNFPKYSLSVNLSRQKPPYLIHITLGDPDSGKYLLFEKKIK